MCKVQTEDLAGGMKRGENRLRAIYEKEFFFTIFGSGLKKGYSFTVVQNDQILI